MKFLADENFPRSLITYLRRTKHDVKDVYQTQLQGQSDTALGRFAIKERQVIITYDKDFLTSQPLEYPNVIVIHFPRTQPKNIIPYMDALLLKLKKNPPKAPYTILLNRQAVYINTRI